MVSLFASVLGKKLVMTTAEIILLGVAVVLLFIFIKDGRKKLIEKMKQRKEKKESDRKYQEDIRVRNAQSIEKFTFAQLVGDKRVDLNKEQEENVRQANENEENDPLKKKELPKFELKQNDMPSRTDAETRIIVCKNCGAQYNKNYGACPKCGSMN